MDKLLALPIAGDSYLLHSQGVKILVDGGHSSLSLSAALASPDVAVRDLDIVVCTHADIDHAGAVWICSTSATSESASFGYRVRGGTPFPSF